MSKYSAVALFAASLVGCAKESPPTVVSTAPVAKTVQLSPKAVALGANQSFDFQVITTGFASDVPHSCRLEPQTIGAVAAVGKACRIATGATVSPGRLIALVESVADTATIVAFASR